MGDSGLTAFFAVACSMQASARVLVTPNLRPIVFATQIRAGGSSLSATKQKAPLREAFCLVGYIDVRWNTVEKSLTLMYQKLVDLGFELGSEPVEE